MQTNEELAREICEEYATLTPEQRTEFLDFCIDFWKDKIPEEKIENLKGLKEHEAENH